MGYLGPHAGAVGRVTLQMAFTNIMKYDVRVLSRGGESDGWERTAWVGGHNTLNRRDCCVPCHAAFALNYVCTSCCHMCKQRTHLA